MQYDKLYLPNHVFFNIKLLKSLIDIATLLLFSAKKKEKMPAYIIVVIITIVICVLMVVILPVIVVIKRSQSNGKYNVMSVRCIQNG